MRRIAIILLMCATSLVAIAEGWHYQENQAILMSGAEFLDDDFDNPTYLGIMIDGRHEQDVVAIGIQGDGLTDFRASQLYVVVSFNRGKSEKWRIKELNNEASQYKFFMIVSASKFINRLRSCESLQVTLPIYEYGTKTFYFFADGYPLDW